MTCCVFFSRPNFVLRRGVLLKILHTPYEEKEDWILAAMYKNGTIYLRKILKFATTEEWAKYNSNARHKRLTSWGHNFEDFLLSGMALMNWPNSVLLSEV